MNPARPIRKTGKCRSYRKKGAAIIIVLAFVVLLTGIIVAMLTLSLSNLKVSENNAEQIKVDLFARGAMETTLADLKQEIADGSTVLKDSVGTAVVDEKGKPVYVPSSAARMVPQRIGTDDTLPNLVKRSVRGLKFYDFGTDLDGLARAAAVSTDQSSVNDRNFKIDRWNKSYLLPKKDPSSDTNAAPDETKFKAPDWVLVARDGSNPTNLLPANMSKGGNPVLGRYSYCIYDEGGLLDVNVAGYPSSSSFPTATFASQKASKAGLAYADLSKIFVTAGFAQARADEIVNQLVAWRNYATLKPTGTFASPTFSSTSADNYYSSVLSNLKGFLGVTNSTLFNNQSDRMFASRQEFQKFLLQAVATSALERAQMQVALQYLATYTRDLNQPSTMPDANRPKVITPSGIANNGGNNAFGLDNQINPNFLTIRVKPGKEFTRSNGTAALANEPLAKKRFSLNRLAWLTYKGPSALRTQYKLGDASPGVSNPNYDMWALVNLYGISPALLLQGTAQNIRNYFGLTWKTSYTEPAGPKLDGWAYDVHNGNSGKGPIPKLADIADSASAHDPDFFELLKSAINVGSLGKTLTGSSTVAQLNNGSMYGNQAIPFSGGVAALPVNFRYAKDYDVDAQIMQIGANIISQSRVDGYPVHLIFNNGSGNDRVFPGVKSLPYLNYVFQGALVVQRPATDAVNTGSDPLPVVSTDPTSGSLTSPGVGVLLQIPALWNPHDFNGTVPSLRPTKFRVVVDSTDPDHIDPNGTGNSNYAKYYPIAGGKTTDAAGVQNSNIAAGVNSSSQAHNTSPEYSGIFNINQKAASGHRSLYLTPSGSNLEFTDAGGTLFRESTILFRAGASGNPMNLKNGATGTSTAWNLSSDIGSNVITCPDVNPTGLPALEGGTTVDSANSQYLGIYMGAFPLRFYLPDKVAINPPWTVTTNQVQYWLDAGGASTVRGGLYLTYRVQYQDANNNWVTYDTKYGGPSVNDIFNFHYMQGNTSKSTYNAGSLLSTTAIFGPSEVARDATQSVAFSAAMDPRTARFGLLWSKNGNDVNGQSSLHPPSVEYLAPTNASTHGWIDPVNGVVHSMRPDRNAGYWLMVSSTGGHVPSMPDTPGPQVNAGWITPNSTFSVNPISSFDQFPTGLLPQNNTDVRFWLNRYSGDAPNGPAQNPMYYADADGVVRRGMGAYVPVSSSATAFSSSNVTSEVTIGQPLARAVAYGTFPPSGLSIEAAAGTDPTSARYIQKDATWQINQAQSRPLMLNRPFRSVAELGYVFRDLPWKNLDFFTPESGDSALLDVFCIGDTDNVGGLVAGKVSLNSRQAPVLAAIVSGAYVDDPKISNATIGSISSTAASTIAQALVARTTDASFATNHTGFLQNVSEMVGKWVSGVAPDVSIIVDSGMSATVKSDKIAKASTLLDGKSSYSGFSGIFLSGSTSATNPPMDLTSAYATAFSSNLALKQSITNVQRFHEAPIRALSSIGQTRVWNLMIDLVAQTGSYTRNITDLSAFQVEAEQRYWIHVAIDRFTGQVLDQQIEVVRE